MLTNNYTKLDRMYTHKSAYKSLSKQRTEFLFQASGRHVPFECRIIPIQIHLSLCTHQHVFSQPAFSLGKNGTKTQGEAFLPQERVSSVTTAKGADLIPVW